MEDWKNRLKEEYAQVKERYEKLKAHNTRGEIKDRLGQAFDHEPSREEEREYDTRSALLRDQQCAMGQYLHILELRMVLEGIDP
jgi:hypothetical protein